MYIWLAYEGVQSCRKHGHDNVFIIGYCGYGFVGLGSFMFHTTLKYPWQLFDELNMIYTTCLMAYASLSYSRPNYIQIILAVFLAIFCGLVTLYYHYLQDPTFHQNVYAALTTFIVSRSIYIMEASLRPTLRKSTEQERIEKENSSIAVPSKQEQKYLNDRDLDILKNMWILVGYGLTVFLSGFAIWGLDNVYCSRLHSWRRELGLPWGMLLEGHGWWHLLTGVGAYCYIVWGIWLRRVLNGEQEQYKLVWPAFYRLPEIVKVDEQTQRSGQKVVNGHANKAD